MAFGKPAIATPNRVDLRAVQGAIMSARQRIEFLEAAVTVLQALPNSSAAQITQLQAQISALVAASTTLGQKSPNTVLAGPTGGGQAVPTFRALVAADIPVLPWANLPAFEWRDVPADTILTAADAHNGIAASGNSGSQNIVVPGEDVEIDVGAIVTVAQEGAADVFVVPVSGVQVLYRSGLSTQLGGQYAVAFLQKRAADTWFLYGDLMP